MKPARGSSTQADLCMALNESCSSVSAPPYYVTQNHRLSRRKGFVCYLELWMPDIWSRSHWACGWLRASDLETLEPRVSFSFPFQLLGPTKCHGSGSSSTFKTSSEGLSLKMLSLLFRFLAWLPHWRTLGGDIISTKDLGSLSYLKTSLLAI